MTERGTGYSHRYLQWNILHLLDMARIKSESDERWDETNEETNSSKHNAFNKPNLPRDKELATQPPLFRKTLPFIFFDGIL